MVRRLVGVQVQLAVNCLQLSLLILAHPDLFIEVAPLPVLFHADRLLALIGRLKESVEFLEPLRRFSFLSQPDSVQLHAHLLLGNAVGGLAVAPPVFRFFGSRLIATDDVATQSVDCNLRHLNRGHARFATADLGRRLSAVPELDFVDEHGLTLDVSVGSGALNRDSASSG